MKRIKFKKNKQKEFLNLVLDKSNCPSVKELSERFLGTSYSAWRNYFSEERLLPLDLFEELCDFSLLKKEDFEFEILEKNWGQIKGGKVRRN